jgi:hypothetical protein
MSWIEVSRTRASMYTCVNIWILISARVPLGGGKNLVVRDFNRDGITRTKVGDCSRVKRTIKDTRFCVREPARNSRDSLKTSRRSLL